MKILVDGLPRTTGGIGTLIMNIVNYSASHSDDNIEFDFLISETSGYLDYLNSNGKNYYVVPSLKHPFKYGLSILRLLSVNNYDYLWFNNTSKVNVILPFLAKNYGNAKIISHSHGVKMEETGFKRLLFHLFELLNERIMYSLIDIPFACSNASADYYYKNKEMRSLTKIISNGIDTDLFKFSYEKRCEIRDYLGINEDEILLGAVGRLTPVKNYSFLISLLKTLEHEYKLIIIGEGELKQTLNQQIYDFNLEERCILLGKTSNVQDYLSAMDYFLMPSLHEGLPFSLVEAQCSGLPCVVSNAVSTESKITDLVTFLPIDTVEDWADYLHITEPCKGRYDYFKILKQSNYSIETTYEKFISSIIKVEK